MARGETSLCYLEAPFLIGINAICPVPGSYVYIKDSKHH